MPSPDREAVRRSKRRPTNAWLPEVGPVRDEYVENMSRFVDFCQAQKPPVSVKRTLEALVLAYINDPKNKKE